MNTVSDKNSDWFFNSADATEAYRDALGSGGEAPALVVAAKRMIESASLPDDHTPEEYARDFLDRV